MEADGTAMLRLGAMFAANSGYPSVQQYHGLGSGIVHITAARN
jgi:hypothetical protein